MNEHPLGPDAERRARLILYAAALSGIVMLVVVVLLVALAR